MSNTFVVFAVKPAIALAVIAIVAVVACSAVVGFAIMWIYPMGHLHSPISTPTIVT